MTITHWNNDQFFRLCSHWRDYHIYACSGCLFVLQIHHSQVAGEEYLACRPDPVAAFSGPICGHMNDDHADATKAIVKHYTGLTVESANMLTVDRLGMNVQCTRDGQTFKARVPWVRPAEDRKTIKDVIVEMTRTAAAASKNESVAA